MATATVAAAGLEAKAVAVEEVGAPVVRWVTGVAAAAVVAGVRRMQGRRHR